MKNKDLCKGKHMGNHKTYVIAIMVCNSTFGFYKFQESNTLKTKISQKASNIVTLVYDSTFFYII